VAKLSQVIRDQRREQLIKKYAARREELRNKVRDPNLPHREKDEAVAALAKLPRNSCPTRRNRRCKISGRARGVHQKFEISRIAIRELGLRGQLPGLRKSSW
jgi:small subunit ribosomal protein S14